MDLIAKGPGLAKEHQVQDKKEENKLSHQAGHVDNKEMLRQEQTQNIKTPMNNTVHIDKEKIIKQSPKKKKK